MPAVLSRYRKSISYTALGRYQDPTTIKAQPRLFRFFSSKRLAILALAALLVLLSLAISYSTASSTRCNQSELSQGLSLFPHHVIDAVDWSRFAYTQYATDEPYLCNSVMLFESLHRLGSRAERLLLYPSNFRISDAGTDDESRESRLLRKARDDYNVNVEPVEVVRRNSHDCMCPRT